MTKSIPSLKSLLLKKKSPRAGTLAVVLSGALGATVLFAGPGYAGRTLDEPASIRALSRMVPKRVVEQGLKNAGIKEACSKSLKTKDLEGVRCRMAVQREVAKAAVPKNARGLKKRLQATDDALAVAGTVFNYKPLRKKPGHRKALYDAHRSACAVALDTADALTSLPVGTPDDVRAAAKAALDGTDKKPGLFQRSCECARDTIVASQGAQASESERGAAQAALTSRGCFLDKSKVAVKRGGPERAFSGAAQNIAAANTHEALLLEFAKTRDVGLNRCRQKAMSNGTLTDKAKMESCACGEIKRYKFPKERGRKDISIIVPIDGTNLGVSAVVNAPGKVKACGPLTGPLAR